MKPYYDEDGITIFLGDCREVLPTLPKCDLLCTDPPYGIGEHGGKCRTRGAAGYSKHENRGWDTATPSASIFSLMLSLTTHQVIWGGNYFADKLPPKMGWLYWQKLMGGDFSDGELAWTSRDGALRQYTKCPKGMDKQHPCEKPLDLIKWCFRFFPDTKTILDAYCGSGTTLRAAKDLGLKAIGIEIEERYCEIAANRLRQGVLFGAKP